MKHDARPALLLIVVLLMTTPSARADVTVPAILGDHMVLQQETETAVARSVSSPSVMRSWPTGALPLQNVAGIHHLR